MASTAREYIEARKKSGMTWEEFRELKSKKKEDIDFSETKMEEYRKQLDAEREQLLKRSADDKKKRKKKHKKDKKRKRSEDSESDSGRSDRSEQSSGRSKQSAKRSSQRTDKHRETKR